MKCSDIPDEPILRFIHGLGRWATMFHGYENSVDLAMPAGIPEKLARAKIRSLIGRGLVSGCCCGCRGDFEVTAKGLDWLKAREAA